MTVVIGNAFNAESGVATNDVLSADLGTNGLVSKTGTATCKYQTAAKSHNTMGARCISNGSQAVYLAYTGLNSTKPDWRFYWHKAANPGVNMTIGAAYASGNTTKNFDVQLLTSGKVNIRDSAGSTKATGTAVYAFDDSIQYLEIIADHSAQTISLTGFDTVSASGVTSMGSNTDVARAGNCANNNSGTTDIDDFLTCRDGSGPIGVFQNGEGVGGSTGSSGLLAIYPDNLTNFETWINPLTVDILASYYGANGTNINAPAAGRTHRQLISVVLVSSANYGNFTGGGSFASIIAGNADTAFQNLGATVQAHGYNDCIFRIGWEHNGTWEPWKSGSDPTGYAGAFDRAVTQIKAGAPGNAFKFECNYAALSNYSLSSYPTQHDYKGVDMYARPDLHQTATQRANWLAQFMTDFNDAKPLVFSEWGCWGTYNAQGQLSANADDPVFIDEMFGYFRQYSVAYQCYFDVYGSDKIEHRLHSVLVNAGNEYLAQLNAGQNPLPPTVSTLVWPPAVISTP